MRVFVSGNVKPQSQLASRNHPEGVVGNALVLPSAHFPAKIEGRVFKPAHVGHAPALRVAELGGWFGFGGVFGVFGGSFLPTKRRLRVGPIHVRVAPVDAGTALDSFHDVAQAVVDVNQRVLRGVVEAQRVRVQKLRLCPLRGRGERRGDSHATLQVREHPGLVCVRSSGTLGGLQNGAPGNAHAAHGRVGEAERGGRWGAAQRRDAVKRKHVVAADNTRGGDDASRRRDDKGAG